MNNETMGHLIAQLRKEHNLTQKQLADKLGITDKAVSKWERGGGYPDIATLTPLAEVLDITVNELLVGAKNASGSDAKDDSSFAQDVLQYAQKSVSKIHMRLTKTLFAILSALLFIAMAVCVICDIALTRSLTWSPIPLIAIVYTWLIIAPPFYTKKNKITGMLSAASIFLLPFMYLLDIFIGRITAYSGWFWPLGLILSVIGILLAWGFYAIFTVHKPINYWYRGAIAIIVAGAASVLIDLVMTLIEPINLLTMIINIFFAVIVAAVLLFVGNTRVRKRAK